MKPKFLADVAVKEGVPLQAIILEDKAQNTGENLSRTKALSECRAR